MGEGSPRARGDQGVGHRSPAATCPTSLPEGLLYPLVVEEGPTCHLRPLIPASWRHNCWQEGPQNLSLFIVQRQEGVHDQHRTPDWGVSEVTAAWPSCPRGAGLDGAEEGEGPAGSSALELETFALWATGAAEEPSLACTSARGQDAARLPCPWPAPPLTFPLCSAVRGTQNSPLWLRDSLSAEREREG